MSTLSDLPACEKAGGGYPCFPIEHTVAEAPNGTRFAKCRACHKPFLYTVVHEKVIKGLPHVATPPNPDYPKTL